METALFLGILIIGVICFKNKTSYSWKELKEMVWDAQYDKENL